MINKYIRTQRQRSIAVAVALAVISLGTIFLLSVELALFLLLVTAIFAVILSIMWCIVRWVENGEAQ